MYLDKSSLLTQGFFFFIIIGIWNKVLTNGPQWQTRVRWVFINKMAQLQNPYRIQDSQECGVNMFWIFIFIQLSCQILITSSFFTTAQQFLKNDCRIFSLTGFIDGSCIRILKLR